MLSRFAFKAAKPHAAYAIGAAGLKARCLSTTTTLANKAAQGSKGRVMPQTFTRATAPASGIEATLTIRVSCDLDVLGDTMLCDVTNLWHRMGPCSMVLPSAPTPISLAKPYSPPPWSATPSR